MSTQTTHLNLDLREASDIFNPLSTNSNFETLDDVIYEIQQKGGVPTYTTTASANLLKLSQNPTPNETVFKFVAAGDANTWSYQETVNNIVALDGAQKTVKAGEMYVAWVNAANAMVVIAWPDVVNAQTFDGKGPSEWASKAQLDAVNETAANANTTATAAATVANNALEVAQSAKQTKTVLWTNPNPDAKFNGQLVSVEWSKYSTIRITASTKITPNDNSAPFTPYSIDIPVEDLSHWINKVISMTQIWSSPSKIFAVLESRTIQFTSGGIQFGNEQSLDLTNTVYPTTAYQDRLSPYQIIGIK